MTYNEISENKTIKSFGMNFQFNIACSLNGYKRKLKMSQIMALDIQEKGSSSVVKGQHVQLRMCQLVYEIIKPRSEMTAFIGKRKVVWGGVGKRQLSWNNKKKMQTSKLSDRKRQWKIKTQTKASLVSKIESRVNRTRQGNVTSGTKQANDESDRKMAKK